MKIRRSYTALVGGAMLAAGLLAGPLMPRDTHAQISICRDDPVVSLLNLGQLDLHSTIADTTSDVKTIAYVVHAPVGTHLLAVVNPDGLFGLHSTVKFYADDTANTYDVYTTITTGHTGVAVTSSTVLVSLLNLNLGSSSASGISGQLLHTHFKPLL